MRLGSKVKELGPLALALVVPDAGPRAGFGGWRFADTAATKADVPHASLGHGKVVEVMLARGRDWRRLGVRCRLIKRLPDVQDSLEPSTQRRVKPFRGAELLQGGTKPLALRPSAGSEWLARVLISSSNGVGEDTATLADSMVAGATVLLGWLEIPRERDMEDFVMRALGLENALGYCGSMHGLGGLGSVGLARCLWDDNLEVLLREIRVGVGVVLKAHSASLIVADCLLVEDGERAARALPSDPFPFSRLLEIRQAGTEIQRPTLAGASGSSFEIG